MIEGIVALADTQIVRGSEQVNKQELAEFLHAGQLRFHDDQWIALGSR